MGINEKMRRMDGDTLVWSGKQLFAENCMVWFR